MHLFYIVECVSVDENESRIFISDSYHNRILITDIDGKILDCVSTILSSNCHLFFLNINRFKLEIQLNFKFSQIGSSSPGFEDGEFESAKLSSPAASYYFDTTDCLYFVDSEVELKFCYHKSNMVFMPFDYGTDFCFFSSLWNFW